MKNWPQERFAQLVDQLAVLYDAAFFIIGAPEDKVYGEEAIQKTHTPIANFCGQTEIHGSNRFITKNGFIHYR